MKIDMDRKKQMADDFLALHRAPTIFILPNTWEVASGKIAKELMTTGTYQRMSESSITYSEVNQWFTRGRGAR